MQSRDDAKAPPPVLVLVRVLGSPLVIDLPFFRLRRIEHEHDVGGFGQYRQSPFILPYGYRGVMMEPWPESSG